MTGSVVVAEEVVESTKATPKVIWSLLADFEGWPKWDPFIKSCKYESSDNTIIPVLKVGTKGILQPCSGPAVNFEVVECKEGEQFTTLSWLPLGVGSIKFYHLIETIPVQSEDAPQRITRLTLRVEMSEGLFAWIFRRFLIGPHLAQSLPVTTKNLMMHAEQLQ